MDSDDLISNAICFQGTLCTFFQNYTKATEALELEIVGLKLENPPIISFKMIQLETLKKFHDELLFFKGRKNFGRVVRDSKWNEIIELAKSLYTELSREANFEEIYPEFFCNLQRRGGNDRKKLWDFSILLRSIWELSNKDYQQRFWVAKEKYYSDFALTMENLEEDIEIVLDTSDHAVEMTDKQREMIQNLYGMLEDFDAYGVNNAAIIEDLKFAKCREYAQLVYEELSGDYLEACD
ncbi:MAG: hypothetical protein KFB93_00640 [Simkaniaceae bacterium]|nr:MAG: hypothetical protein KFB93_00640 [Simkaniaceae bacterium]